MSNPRIPTSVRAVTSHEGELGPGDPRFGAELKARRERIGMSQRAMAERIGHARSSVAKIEAGQTVQNQYEIIGAMDKVLTDYERRSGLDLPSQVAQPTAPASGEDSGIVEFDITGDFGVHVVVKGPVRDADALRRQAAALIAEIRAVKDNRSEG